MKFTKLSTKSDKLINKKINGMQINPEKINKLQQLLHDKKLRYEEKLMTDISAEKRISFATKLKVINAQIEKHRLLSSDQSS